MALSELPQDKEKYFTEQYGYKDVKIITQKYQDKPTPLKAEQNAAQTFFADHTDKKHQKEYAKRGANFLVRLIANFICK